MSDRKVICAKCKVPVQAHSDLQPDTVVSCPVCGESDTAANASREAADHLHEQAVETINRPLKELAARSKSFKFIPAPREKREYRFILGD